MPRSIFEELQRVLPDAFEERFPEDRSRSSPWVVVRGPRFPGLPPEGTLAELPRRGEHLRIVSSREPIELAPIEVGPAPTGKRGPWGEPTDALAWYVPYHFSSNRWGIYLTEHGIDKVAGVVLAGLMLREPGRAQAELTADAVTYGANFLLRHEAFHFAVEMFATGLEAAQRVRMYRPYEEVYTSQAGTDDWVEEQLANFWAAGGLSRRSIMQPLQELLFPMLASSPPGYRAALPLLERRFHFTEAETFAVLANHVAQGSATIEPGGPVGRFLALPGTGITRYDGYRVPRYLVLDRGGKYLEALWGGGAKVQHVTFLGPM